MTMRGQLNLKQLRAYRPAWAWEEFRKRSTDLCLKWSARDLHHLDAALKFVPGRTAVIQAGGNIGLFPKRLAEEFRTVYTFEPSPSLFDVLCTNAPERNIVKLQAALGADRGPVGVHCSRRDGSTKPVHEGLTHIVEKGVLPCLMVDDLQLAALDLLYLDIEGFEMEALRGAKATIFRCRPVIAIEINRNCAHYGVDAATAAAQVESVFDMRQVLQVDSDHIFVPLERTP